jgi:N6-L-threonylcarbamoyladenine synthase
LYFLRDERQKNPDFVEQNLLDICASLQQHLVNMLLSRLQQASDQTGIKSIAIAGGVSANSGLRKNLAELGESLGWTTFIPEFQYCTDNAAMIAITAHHKFLKGEFSSLEVVPLARMPI